MKPAALLDSVTPGFSDSVLGSQAVFRQCLECMSRPGSLEHIASDAQLPPGVGAAAGAVLLSLLDQDTRLWLSPSARAAADYLRFHTGCVLVEDPGAADFAFAARAAELPGLAQFAQGSEDYPDRSTTLVVQVETLAADAAPAGPAWVLRGPGIRDSVPLSAAGLGQAFIEQWSANQRRFPCGVDLFLACGSRLAALPRTTRLEAACM